MRAGQTAIGKKPLSVDSGGVRKYPVYNYGPREHNWRPMGEHRHHSVALIDNLRQEMPFWRKIRLVLANNFIKIKSRHNCCGNLGQPGC